MLNLVQFVDEQGSPCPAERALASVQEARNAGLGIFRPIAETEVKGLADAAGRVLAQTIKADSPLPRFDHSAMDGYAINTDGIGPGARLNVIGRIIAGRADETVALNGNGAIRIMTGARIPAGANAVVAQEYVERDGDRITLLRAPVAGEHIRLRAEDAQAGDTLIRAGTRMGPLEIGIAASMGLSDIRVYRKLRVAILATGSELRQPGEKTSAGEIYDANRFVLRSLLSHPWVDVVDLGICPDRPRDLAISLQNAVSRADIVISSGGVSAGDEDRMIETVRRAGGEILVKGVAIKPGKPLALGRIGPVPYVGLPGNPGAAFTTFLVIVDDLIRKRAGLKPRVAPERPATADFEWRGKPGRTVYLPAVTKGYASGSPLVDLLPGANSGKLYLLSRAEGFAVIGPDINTISPGDQIGWFPIQ
jgi:molybdopterin molybdotransferase